jgi:hypothetical protein
MNGRSSGAIPVGCDVRECNWRDSWACRGGDKRWAYADAGLLRAGKQHGVALVRTPRERDEFSIGRPAVVPNLT